MLVNQALRDFAGRFRPPRPQPRVWVRPLNYNAEMIEQIARFPRLRDRAIFVGNPSDVVPDGFGTGLPLIRDWIGQNYQFSGYVSGFEPIGPDEREAVRAELGYQPGEKICLVTVGGSGVGTDLLRRAAAACPAAKQLVPGLRMILVTGPRIDPDSLPAAGGLEVHGYVHDLYRYLAACDLAVVQGGLTTTMELTRVSGRSSTYRCATTSSRTSTSGTGWPSTAPAAAWTTSRRRRTCWYRRSRRRSIVQSATGRSRPRVPRERPRASPS